jgi:hypothetical protein
MIQMDARRYIRIDLDKSIPAMDTGISKFQLKSTLLALIESLHHH